MRVGIFVRSKGGNHVSIALQEQHETVVIFNPATPMMKRWLRTQGCFSSVTLESSMIQPSSQLCKKVIDFSQFRNRLRAH